MKMNFSIWNDAADEKTHIISSDKPCVTNVHAAAHIYVYEIKFILEMMINLAT